MKYGKYVVVLERFNGDEFNPEWNISKLFTLDQSDRCRDENDARSIAMDYWQLTAPDLMADDSIVKVYIPETHDENFTPECHPGITPETLENGATENEPTH